ncbi:MAG TPA: hypothetical protein VM143_09950 [Acidimicrobiales bacterium]|nr:hypothetical protein [Acidimicrobiales bacterium]
MHVRVERVDRAVSRCRAERADGVVVEFLVHNHPGRLPHDLCHFAVESTLGLADGFWSLLDRGVMFKGVARAGGTGKGRPARRLVQRRGDQLDEIELLVAGVTGCWENDDRAVTVAGFSHDEVSACHDALDSLDAQWQKVGIGEALSLEWALDASNAT